MPRKSDRRLITCSQKDLFKVSIGKRHSGQFNILIQCNIQQLCFHASNMAQFQKRLELGMLGMELIIQFPLELRSTRQLIARALVSHTIKKTSGPKR
jgi:hypothetical protein